MIYITGAYLTFAVLYAVSRKIRRSIKDGRSKHTGVDHGNRRRTDVAQNID